MWNSVNLNFMCINILCSKCGWRVGGGNSLIYSKCNEILQFVPLSGLVPCLPAWLGLPLAGLLGGMAWVALVWPACCVRVRVSVCLCVCVSREAWLALVPVALVAWVYKTRSIYEKGMRQGMRWYAPNQYVTFTVFFCLF